MRGIEGGTDGGDGLQGTNAVGGCKGSGAAQRVTHEQLRCGVVLGQPVGGGLDVCNVLAETGICEISLGLSQAWEVEAQGGDAKVCQLLAHAGGTGGMARAGKAVRKDGEGLRRGVWEVDGSGHRGTGAGGERHVHGLHAHKDIRATARLRTGVD